VRPPDPAAVTVAEQLTNQAVGAPNPPHVLRYGGGSPTSFNDPSGEAGKEVHSVSTAPRERRPRPVTGDRTAAHPVLDAADVGRVLTRMAHEIVEKTGGAGDVVLLGIPTRGVTLARRIGERVSEIEQRAVPVGALDVTLYRDDLHLRGVRALGQTVLPPGGVDGRVVVLVDDVLFSGRTVRAALDAIGEAGRPAAVQLAVLVDRGHRELPIRADYVGKNIPTSLRETVHVLLAEHDGRDGVLLGPADLSRADANSGEGSS
jgi:pyrimidine operon attenuation protein / uracil phosphoribosyltransferase